jgi:hypothetical protein
MKFPLRTLFVATLLGSFLGGLRGWAEEPAVKTAADASKTDKSSAKAEGDESAVFLRIRRDDDDRPLALETAIVHYVPKDASATPVQIDLIGAVHVGDKSYYDELNRRFAGYDALLYELVAPPGAKIPKGGRQGKGSGHPIGAMQDGMKSILELEHQLDKIDYTAKNFVHADMSPEEFSQTMEDRGESFTQMFFRLLGQGAAQQATGKSNDFGLLMAFFSRDRAVKLKIAMAEQFENLEGQMAAFNGPEGSTIITERNKKAFEVLAKELKAGKKKIGVFYGAGHLPDMEQRLLKDFGMKRQSIEWGPAWSLSREGSKKDLPEGK